MIVGLIKPKGPTSHDMIYRVRRIAGVKRVGHAGTLDPAASGVLVVAIGRESTKKLAEIVKQDKEYLAKVTLGATSTTDDGEGEILVKDAVDRPDERKVVESVAKFVGKIMQVPPKYSAIKMGGRKAYELARKGKEVVMVPREVIIHSIKVIKYEWPELEIRVHCGKGVYIRSLARDIGESLGLGGYMSSLERTRVGDFSIEKCITTDELEQLWMKKAGQS